MTKFEIHDTKGGLRDVCADCKYEQMLVHIMQFKTHCATNDKPYEYNHFVNWVKKNYDLDITYQDSTFYRVDM